MGHHKNHRLVDFLAVSKVALPCSQLSFFGPHLSNWLPRLMQKKKKKRIPQSGHQNSPDRMQMMGFLE